MDYVFDKYNILALFPLSYFDMLPFPTLQNAQSLLTLIVLLFVTPPRLPPRLQGSLLLLLQLVLQYFATYHYLPSARQALVRRMLTAAFLGAPISWVASTVTAGSWVFAACFPIMAISWLGCFSIPYLGPRGKKALANLSHRFPGQYKFTSTSQSTTPLHSGEQTVIVNTTHTSEYLLDEQDIERIAEVLPNSSPTAAHVRPRLDLIVEVLCEVIYFCSKHTRFIIEVIVEGALRFADAPFFWILAAGYPTMLMSDGGRLPDMVTVLDVLTYGAAGAVGMICSKEVLFCSSAWGNNSTVTAAVKSTFEGAVSILLYVAAQIYVSTAMAERDLLGTGSSVFMAIVRAWLFLWGVGSVHTLCNEVKKDRNLSDLPIFIFRTICIVIAVHVCRRRVLSAMVLEKLKHATN